MFRFSRRLGTARSAGRAIFAGGNAVPDISGRRDTCKLEFVDTGWFYFWQGESHADPLDTIYRTWFLAAPIVIFFVYWHMSWASIRKDFPTLNFSCHGFSTCVFLLTELCSSMSFYNVSGRLWRRGGSGCFLALIWFHCFALTLYMPTCLHVDNRACLHAYTLPCCRKHSPNDPKNAVESVGNISPNLSQ